MNRFEFLNEADDFGVITIENSFINHYMPKARGDYVKVYLYGLKCCNGYCLDGSTFDIIAQNLNMKIDTVEDAFKYWEKQNIINIISDSAGNIIQYRNICAMFMTPEKINKKPNKTKTKQTMKIRQMNQNIEQILGRTITHDEIDMFLSWIEEYNFSTQTVILLIDNGIKSGKRGMDYWHKVSKDWHEKNIQTFDQADNYLKQRASERNNFIEIMNYLGFYRTPTKPEEAIMNKWLNEYNLTMEQIKKACDKTTATNKPSFDYIDSIINNLYINLEEKTISKPKSTSKKSKLENESNYNEDDVRKALFGE